MRLPELAIRNSSFTWIVLILLTLIGIRSFLDMPRTENPELSIPGTSVVFAMPGASPVDMEKLIGLPVEEALNELDDIVEISTSVETGMLVTSVEFEYSTDADKKYEEVVQAINSIRDEFPEEIMYSDIWQWTITDISILQLALISDSASFRELKNEAERLKNLIELNPAIKKVEFHGLPEEEIHIFLDFSLMAHHNTGLEQVIAAIESNNIIIPSGDISIGNKSINITTSGSYDNLEEIRNTVVNSSNGKLIYLKDIATVSRGYENLKYYTRFGSAVKQTNKKISKKAIFVTASQKEDRNVLKTQKELSSAIDDFTDHLPPGITLECVFDQASRVESRINGFLANLLQGIILVGIIILISLGIRSSIIVILTIPLSIIISLGFVYMLGYGLQQISIAALVVALGLLVDNSIVMIENINRYRMMGKGRIESSTLAASEIGWPLIAATVTTLLAFIPIANMPDKAGEFIESLPVTIMITLTVSLLIALTVTPLISSSLLKSTGDMNSKERSGPGRLKVIKWIIENPFRQSLAFSLSHPWFIIAISIIILAISGLASSYVGISFFPSSQQANLMIKTTLPEGSSISATDRVARYIESVLDTVPEIKYYATNTGHGNPQIYYNVFPERYSQRYCDIYVELYEYQPEAYNKLLSELRHEFEYHPGARIRVKEFEQGPPFDAPVQIFIHGNDLNELRRISSDIEDYIISVPGIINPENKFNRTNTEIFIDINEDKAGMLGVPKARISQTIRTAVNGIRVSAFRDKNGEESDIILRMQETRTFKPEDLNKVYVSSMSGRLIPLNQLIDVRLKQSPSSITRRNHKRTAEIVADVDKGYNLNDVIFPIIDKLESYSFPVGYSYEIGGEFKGRNDTFAGMSKAIVIAIFSIFAVLVLQFRSLRQPLIIFIAVPFAAIGMIWALLITGYTFSFTAFIGLISLAGIVVNNSIILVDYTNRLRYSGKTINEALQEAAEIRLTPILLTALTTIGGLLPLTLRGGTLWAPMGWTIIGGLLVSTLLTLIIVPVFYLVLVKESRLTKP